MTKYETVTAYLGAWDAGTPVFSVEMGGLVPGYEQAIQITMFEILRHWNSQECDTGEWEDKDKWKRAVDDALINALESETDND